MSFDTIWKMAVAIFLAGGIYTWVRSEIANLKRDLNGLGTRSKNAEWERYKLHLIMMSYMDEEADRKWMCEQFLKR